MLLLKILLYLQKFVELNNKKMKIRLFIISFMAVLSLSLLTSCATKQTAINQLQNLAYDMRDNGAYYNVDDWKQAAADFMAIRDKMRKYDYTPAERHQIGELEGECAKYMVQGIKNGAINTVLGIGSEIKGILDGLGIKY